MDVILPTESVENSNIGEDVKFDCKYNIFNIYIYQLQLVKADVKLIETVHLNQYIVSETQNQLRINY